MSGRPPPPPRSTRETHHARLESELRSVRRQRDGQQRVADKEIDLRHIVDADMPADFLIKTYHLKN